MHSSASSRSRREAARHVDAGVEHARAAGERVHGDAQLRRPLDGAIGQIAHARSFIPRSVMPLSLVDSIARAPAA